MTQGRLTSSGDPCAFPKQPGTEPLVCPRCTSTFVVISSVTRVLVVTVDRRLVRNSAFIQGHRRLQELRTLNLGNTVVLLLSNEFLSPWNCSVLGNCGSLSFVFTHCYILCSPLTCWLLAQLTLVTRLRALRGAFSNVLINVVCTEILPT